MSLGQSSPRLPSPPPPAEDQVGPRSPGLSSQGEEAQQMEQTVVDTNAKRRIHKGTKAEDMAAGPPLVPLNELDSAFQLQEHLAALHYHFSQENTIPINRDTAIQMTTPPPGIDRTLWLYELCRLLIAECNSLIVGFLFDAPPCSSATCPEMRASEWQFLCAVHESPKSCCAIDYCCHTLDWAANIVTNPRIFPSRFVVTSDAHDKSAVLKNLVNVFRRLHRIFAHAWFQHRGVFWSVEAQTGLYVFFKTVCDLYDLLPAENYKLPPEAEGQEPDPSEKETKKPSVTSIAKPPSQNADGTESEEDRHNLSARRSNTARHSSRPSTGSAVTTVTEEPEEEPAGVTNKLKDLNISESLEEESELEVPVIVEDGVVDEPPTYVKEAGAGETPDEHTYGVKIDVQEDVPVETDSPEVEAEDGDETIIETNSATDSESEEELDDIEASAAKSEAEADPPSETKPEADNPKSDDEDEEEEDDEADSEPATPDSEKPKSGSTE